jgi:FdhE protein
MNQDGALFQRYAEDSALFATLTQAAVTPLLLACGRHASELISGSTWGAGFCPVCAAWPLLAEIRGLEQQRWLRCGRCASSWQAELHRCIYCGNQDFQTLGYLAAESSSEARRVVTCEHCRGYLKTVTTFGAQSYVDMTRLDLSTVELDIAAILHDYARPGDAGYALCVEVALT